MSRPLLTVPQITICQHIFRRGQRIDPVVIPTKLLEYSQNAHIFEKKAKLQPSLRFFSNISIGIGCFNRQTILIVLSLS